MQVELFEIKDKNNLVQFDSNLIDKKLLFKKVQNDNNNSIFIEIPIIGSVINHT